MSRYDDEDDIDRDPDERYRRRPSRRYYDHPDDDPDNVDRDVDHEYRRRVRRYGEEVTDEEEDEEEKEQEESDRAARRKCLWPGLLMIAAGALGILGTVGFVAAEVAGAGGAAPGVTAGWLCAGVPMLFGVVFCGFQVGGGVCLVRRRARGMAITGGALGGMAAVTAVFAGMIAGFSTSIWMVLAPCLLGVPAAIWMFVTLQDHDVQDAFERSRRYG